MSVIPKNKNIRVPKTNPLAFHIRGRRQWYGDEGLKQGELAKLAGVSTTFVEQYERARSIPASVHKLLRLALALHVPFERLFAPQLVDRLVDEIEARRRAWVTEKNGNA